MSSWEQRVQAFWSSADDRFPDGMLSEMATLVAERPSGDADAMYEWASVHDFLGREPEAVPLYRAAIAGGLGEPRLTPATIQLASSLRNIGEPDAAVALLTDFNADPSVGGAPQAFLSLALHDCGRHAEALRVALRALGRTLPSYGRAVVAYADDLVK